jgi:IS30 family transposase
LLRRGAEWKLIAPRASFALRDAGHANKNTESVVSALIKQSQRLPSELYRSLTWDRGKELADHQHLTLATEVEVNFCDPWSPWQRGSNENTNRLVRQYLPRGTDLSYIAKPNSAR